MNGHDFRLPFPEADAERCYNCGAGKESPRGEEACRPIQSWMAFRSMVSQKDSSKPQRSKEVKHG